MELQTQPGHLAAWVRREGIISALRHVGRRGRRRLGSPEPAHTAEGQTSLKRVWVHGSDLGSGLPPSEEVGGPQHLLPHQSPGSVGKGPVCPGGPCTLRAP